MATTLNQKMFEAQGGLCCYCEKLMVVKPHVNGKPTDPMTATREHLKRKIEGGTNYAGNLRLACAECNQGRGSVDWATYKSYRMGETISV